VQNFDKCIVLSQWRDVRGGGGVYILFMLTEPKKSYAMKVEAAVTPQKFVNFYQTIVIYHQMVSFTLATARSDVNVIV
jgi:hypothetical protein